MSVGIVTDSGCDFPQPFEGQQEVNVVPLIFRFGLKEYADKSMVMKDFLKMIEQTWPTTSGPSAGEYIRAFGECLDYHEKVLCLPITSKHSSSYSSAVVASQHFDPGQVTVLDSETLSIGQGFLVQAAAQAARLGELPEKIVARLKDLQSRSHLYIILDTVKNVVRGGRASHLTGILAGILQIRPVLTLVRGQLTLLDRTRGRIASKQKMIERVIKCLPAKSIAVAHVDCTDEANELAAQLTQQVGIIHEDIPVIETGMTIAAHGGPGTLGVAVISNV